MLFHDNSLVLGCFGDDEAEFYGEIPMKPYRPLHERPWVEVEDIPEDATLGLGRMWKGRQASSFEDEVDFLADQENPLDVFYAEIDARIAREDGFGSEFGDPYSDRLFEFLYGLDRTGEMDAVELLEMALVAAADRRKVKAVNERIERRAHGGESHHAKRPRFRKIMLISAAA